MIEWIVSSCVLILIVTILRCLLKGKMPLRLQYALWGLVLLRLLVPFSLGESSISVMNVVREQKEEYYIWHTSTDPAQSGSPVNEPAEIPQAGTAAPGINLKPDTEEMSVITAGMQLDRILYGIWITGIAAAAALLLFSNFRFAVRLRRSRQRVGQGLTTLPVYVSEVVETPCLFGLFRPAIYVTPEVLVNQITLQHVLAHETTHYRHGDHIWALLRSVCLALHWYNPLVWLAATFSRWDGELACDEGTIKYIGEEERTDYGRTLIGLTCTKRGALLTTATAMTWSKRSLKERIGLIAKKPKTLTAALIIAAVVCLVAVGCTFTGAQTIPNTSNTPDSVDDIGQTYDILVSVGPEVESSNPALESAITYVTQKIQTFNEGWKEIAPGNRITEGKIVAITDVSAIAMENIRLDLYLLEYRLLLDGDVQQVLAGGMDYEEIDGEVWLTEWESTGQPYLLEYSELLDGQIIWAPICTTTTEEIDLIYSASKELEAEFGLDKYTIVAQELYKAHVGEKSDGDVSLTEEEIARVNEAFEQLVDNGEGGLRVNPLSCFFTSFYDDPKSLDLVQFLAYFPSAEALTDQKEFDALKASEYFPFDADITLEDMPVPVHKISAQAIDEVLQRYAGISLSECEDAGKSSSELLYLDEYNAYYNFTSDFAAGYFSCINGEKQGEHIILYSNYSVLTLRKSGENYLIQSFQPI